MRDTEYTGLREPFEPIAFLPTTQERRPLEYVNIALRASGLVTTRTLADAVSRTEPRAVVLVQSFRAQVADSLVRERLVAMLSGFFGAVAALLAMLGLYGVVSLWRDPADARNRYSNRARRGAISRAVARAASEPAAHRHRRCIGARCRSTGTRYFEAILFGLEPLDPATFIAVPCGFALLAALAPTCLLDGQREWTRSSRCGRSSRWIAVRWVAGRVVRLRRD